MPAADPDRRFRSLPVFLTFIAPASRCNQRCPACLLDRVADPVRTFALTPEDYALSLEQLVVAGVPVASVSFQGYEVTLPNSWPYVEATFTAANRLGLRKSFVTNGMLLDRWVERIVALRPDIIAVSIDGGDETTHDRHRGLPGAFRATHESLRRFLSMAPSFRDRIKIVSTVYDRATADSLSTLPTRLDKLGIRRWSLGFELDVADGWTVPVASPGEIRRWVCELRRAAKPFGIRFEFQDPFAFVSGQKPTLRDLAFRELVVRVEPAGYVRVGDELRQRFDEGTARVFHPRRMNLVDVIEYEKRCHRLRSALSKLQGEPQGRIEL